MEGSEELRCLCVKHPVGPWDKDKVRRHVACGTHQKMRSKVVAIPVVSDQSIIVYLASLVRPVSWRPFLRPTLICNSAPLLAKSHGQAPHAKITGTFETLDRASPPAGTVMRHMDQDPSMQ